MMVFISFALNEGFLKVLNHFIEISYPLLLFSHVVIYEYDKKALPEYSAFFEKSGCARSVQAPLNQVSIPISLLSLVWVLTLAYRVDVGAAIFAGGIILMTILLDYRKNWSALIGLACLFKRIPKIYNPIAHGE